MEQPQVPWGGQEEEKHFIPQYKLARLHAKNVLLFRKDKM